MSLIGVYPNQLQMSKEQLIEYTYFLESQMIEKEIQYEKKIKELVRELNES